MNAVIAARWVAANTLCPNLPSGRSKHSAKPNAPIRIQSRRLQALTQTRCEKCGLGLEEGVNGGSRPCRQSRAAD